MTIRSAPSHACVRLRKTLDGRVMQKVVLVAPDAAHFRTFSPPLRRDDAVRRALASTGVRAAMLQAELPMERAPGKG